MTPSVKLNDQAVDIVTGDIAISYSLAEIQDIDSRNSARTKTVTVAAKGNNELVMGFGTDINSKKFLTQNEIIRASIDAGEVNVLNGVAKVVSANTTKKTYNINIFGDAGNWKEQMKGRTLKDLDFSKYD